MRKLLVVLAILATLAAPACSDDDDDAGGDAARPTTSATAPSASAGPATTAVQLTCGPTGGEFFEVVAEDFAFEPDCDRLQVRLDQDLRATNVGKVTHNVTIAPAYDQDIEPGKAFETGKIGGGLQPGTYELECSIHRSRGMTATLEILPA